MVAKLDIKIKYQQHFCSFSLHFVLTIKNWAVVSYAIATIMSFTRKISLHRV